jgi:hypothetical protein
MIGTRLGGARIALSPSRLVKLSLACLDAISPTAASHSRSRALVDPIGTAPKYSSLRAVCMHAAAHALCGFSACILARRCESWT